KERFQTFLRISPPTYEELEMKALRFFKKGIEDTKKEAWKIHPKKHANLFEWHFRQDSQDPFTPEILSSSEEKIKQCLQNWHASPIGKMAFQKEARWISVEELTHFFVGKYKILVVIDFAMKWVGKSGKEKVILFYWKTGQPTEKSDEQLYSYALYAHEMFKAPYENIILSPFYLYYNNYFKIGTEERPLEVERLEKVKKTIEKSCDHMASKLKTLTPSASDPQP